MCLLYRGRSRDELIAVHEAARAELVAEYEERFANPYAAAEAGLVDAVIEPAQTRAWVAASLGFLRAKRSLRPRKKHGLIPL